MESFLTYSINQVINPSEPIVRVVFYTQFK